MRERGVMQRDTLERITWEWRESLLVSDASIGLTTAYNRIKTLNSILAGLSDAQVFPEVFPLPGIPSARRQVLPRPTFAQMSHGDRANVILARENVAKSEQAAFLRALEQERVREKDLPKDSVKAMEEINRRRLVRLRDIAVKVCAMDLQILNRSPKFSGPPEPIVLAENKQ